MAILTKPCCREAWLLPGVSVAESVPKQRRRDSMAEERVARLTIPLDRILVATAVLRRDGC